MTAQTAQAEPTPAAISGCDRMIDALCALGLGALFVLLALRWPALPEYIPTHAGNLASVDKKSILLSLPLLAVLTYALLTLLRPIAAALPLWKPAEHNRAGIQAAAVSLLSTVKFWGIAMLLVPAVDRISIAATGLAACPPLILPLSGVCLAVTLLSGVRRIRRLQLELPQSAALDSAEDAIPLSQPEAPPDADSAESQEEAD